MSTPPPAPTPSPTIRTSAAAPTIHLLGHDLRVLLSADDTGGSHSLFELVAPPGDGPPPHVHSNEDETFFVLEGTLEFLIASGGADGGFISHRVGPGGCVFGPRGVPHTYRNPGTIPARALLLTTPSGFEGFASAVAKQFPKGSTVDVSLLVSIMTAHGIKPLPPRQ